MIAVLCGAESPGAVDKFFDISESVDSEVVKLCREQKLHIAIDLKGYTQFNRVELFSYRLAPVQISYLGYPGTIGAPFMGLSDCRCVCYPCRAGAALL